MIKREKGDNPNIVFNVVYKVYYITQKRTHCTKKVYPQSEVMLIKT